MSCSYKSTLFKQGDSFYLELEILDSQTNEPVEITDDYEISASVNNRFGTHIADFEIVEYDQILNKGKFALSFNDTSTWPVGEARMDVKIVIDGLVRHSATITFEIIKSETV